jgi:hypothetical protein
MPEDSLEYKKRLSRALNESALYPNLNSKSKGPVLAPLYIILTIRP